MITILRAPLYFTIFVLLILLLLLVCGAWGHRRHLAERRRDLERWRTGR